MREIDEVSALLDKLEDIKIWSGMVDRRVWLDDTEDFSVKSMTGSLSQISPISAWPFVDLIWKAKVPSKVQFFGWLLVSNKLSTDDVLQRRFPSISGCPSCCPLCHRDADNRDHLFRTCSFASKVWSFLFARLPVDVLPPVDCPFSDFSLWFGSSGKSSKVRSALKVVFLAACWAIWKLRNKCIFDDASPCFDTLWDSLFRNIGFWLATLEPEFHSFNLASLSRDWPSAL